MKILHCAPIDIETSTRLKYAGTERVLLYLNMGLSKDGHNSIVAAPGNSDLGGYGALLPTRDLPLWLATGENRAVVRSSEAYEQHYGTCLDFALENKIDIIHDHPGQFIFASEVYTKVKHNYSVPIVTTIHSPTVPQCEEVATADGSHIAKYNLIRNLQKENLPLYIVSVSRSHKEEHEKIGIKIDDFVYNGIDLNLFPFRDVKQDYILWLGRLSGIKGTDLAVQVARRTKRPLIIAGEVHGPYKELFKNKIEPHLTSYIKGETAEQVRESLLEKILSGEEIVKEGEIMFFGPVDDRQKAILYSHAFATLQPNRWKEPFGLVPVESMATGTPTIVTNTGALPELVLDGQTGFIIDAFEKEEINDEKIVSGTIEALNKVGRLSPKLCREHIESNFSINQMTHNYLKFYEKVV